ncbi:divergent polysaccharide deacetylase family protein [Sulfurovum sp. ST-21]|nr:divergent polysaccharide deacetylase family protein [Sulfurovum indicum]
MGRCWIGSDSLFPKNKYEEAVKRESKKPVVKNEVKKDKSVASERSKQKQEIGRSRDKKVKLAYRTERPKLVIIIDDVHTRKQLDTIQNIGFPVTPSIFPPYTLSPDTHKLARNAVHYMIHLPMESGNAKYDSQSKTLKTTFSRAQLEERMRELRRLFPRAHYINNHTGSRFTANDKAMGELYKVMKKEGFVFIDSRTVGGSKVGKIAHKYGDVYVARDIFLDNVKSATAIHSQLKKAVRLAKKNGYAIAIGHPYKVTMQALASAKPLLKEVDVVYIDEIFREE